jgi:molecular chaperone HscB
MQSPLSKDFFSLFGLPVSYHITSADLMARYQEIQSAAHPDKYANASSREKQLSIQLAAHINEAYQTLKNPLSRIRYLLELKGVDTQDKAASPGPEFLARQIELREIISEIQTANSLQDKLDRLQNEISESISALQVTISQELGEADDRGLLSSANKHYNELQYFYRLLEEVRDLEEASE